MTTKNVTIIKTGTANLASVLAGFKRAEANAVLTDNPEDIVNADYVVLPGVGAFKAAMDQLVELKMVDVIKERLVAGKPTMGVCLGLQVLCEGSLESPGVEGLGIIKQKVGKFDDNVRVPQLGWNRVMPDSGCKLLQEGFAYFANSYRLSEKPEGWSVTTSDHGGEFIAAMEKGSLLACQFHPELSGKFGLDLLKRWLQNS